jgi:3-oxoacyl-[acyl-carrier protein] reductase
MQVEGKAAIITGGGTGVGRATALELAKRGCSVLVNYSRSRAEAEATAEEVAKSGVKSLALRANVAQDSDCRAMVEEAVREFGRLDILVNNAGTTVFVPHEDLERLEDDDWHRLFAVNTVGPFNCARAAKGPMEDAGEGEIVNVSSVAGLAGIGSSIPYCASKAALNNVTITLARALAPKIRVNAVAPGFITGRWLKGGFGEAYDAILQGITARAPLKRVCEPEDVSDAIVGLIAGSDLVTGQVLVCDGGLLIAGV